MRSLSVLAASAILIAVVAPANALTVSNQDASDHTIAVVVGEKRSETTVGPGQSLEVACDPGCTLSILKPDGEHDKIDATEADEVMIVEGGFALAE